MPVGLSVGSLDPLRIGKPGVGHGEEAAEPKLLPGESGAENRSQTWKSNISNSSLQQKTSLYFLYFFHLKKKKSLSIKNLFKQVLMLASAQAG